MLDKGIAVNTIKMVTGRSYDSIIKLLEVNNSIDDINVKVYKFFSKDGSIDKKYLWKV